MWVAELVKDLARYDYQRAAGLSKLEVYDWVVNRHWSVGTTPRTPGWWWGVAEDAGDGYLTVSFDVGRNLPDYYGEQRMWNGAAFELDEVGVLEFLDAGNPYSDDAGSDWCLHHGVWEGDLVLCRVEVGYYRDSHTGETDVEKGVDVVHTIRRSPTRWQDIGKMYATGWGKPSA